MDRQKFFAALRKRDSGVFGTSLTQGQVDGINALLAACERNKVVNGHHVANILAQVYRETGGRMEPVRETFAATDDQAIQRLEKAWKDGKLTWVKTPYWRDGWFGRGMIQITHRDNYERLGKAIGVDLVGDRRLALDPDISAEIAVVGMARGLFTGKKLADFTFPAALDEPARTNPRRIVNGPDGSDMQVAGFHRAFFKAISEAGGWKLPKMQQPTVALPTPDFEPDPEPVKPAGSVSSKGIAAAIVALVLGLAAWISTKLCSLVGPFCGG